MGEREREGRGEGEEKGPAGTLGPKCKGLLNQFFSVTSCKMRLSTA